MSDSKPNATADLGVFCMLGVDALEWVARPPLTCLIIDGQHGRWNLDDLRNGLRAAQAAGVKPIVRLPAGGEWMIEAVLDAGCESLLFPMVNTLEQARAVVQACYYPPRGVRSQASCRAALCYGEGYREGFNERFELLVMIEHVEAVRQVEAICTVPGITGCFIGPNDLASSLGEAASPDEMERLIETVRLACQGCGKTVGIFAADMRAARRRLDEGFSPVGVSTDADLLAQAVVAMAAPPMPDE